MEQAAFDFEAIPKKRCYRCGQWKPLSDFHRNRSARDGLQNRCRSCNIATNKQWYRDHPEARANRMDRYAKKRRQENQRRLLEYLRSHPCVDCGESDPVVLEFDHLRDKIANVTAMVGRRWETVMREIAKCDVVCANCHRRRTATRLRSFRFVEGGGGPAASVAESRGA